MIESGLALIAACLPSLNPLWTKIIDSRLVESLISLVSASSRGSRDSRDSRDSRSRTTVPPWQTPHHTPLPSESAASIASQAKMYKAATLDGKEAYELQMTVRENFERGMATSKIFQDGASCV